MAFEVTDQMLRQLTQEWAATLPDQYPEPSRPHRFSLRFHWKMRPILRRARKEASQTGPVPSCGMRFATALLVAALLTATVAMAAPNLRRKIYQMVREKHQQYTRIYYDEAPGQEDQKEFLPYRMTYVPEGFDLALDENTGDSHRQRYENAQGLTVELLQRWWEGSDFTIDAGEAQPEELMLNGWRQARYLENGSVRTVYWNNGEYSFLVSGQLSREEIIKVAESVWEKPGSITPYHLNYVPEGFTIRDVRTFIDSHDEHYINNERLVLALDQSRLGSAFAFSIDTEKVEPVEIILNGTQRAWYLGNPSLKVIYWDDGVYWFQVVGHLSREELIKAAESVSTSDQEYRKHKPTHMTRYAPAYIPEGFELYYEYLQGSRGSSYTLEYDNGYALSFRWDQVRIGAEAEPPDFDIDAPETAELLLNGQRTVRYLEEPLRKIIYWDDGEYFFTLSGSLPRDELIKIAESVTEK